SIGRWESPAEAVRPQSGRYPGEAGCRIPGVIFADAMVSDGSDSGSGAIENQDAFFFGFPDEIESGYSGDIDIEPDHIGAPELRNELDSLYVAELLGKKRGGGVVFFQAHGHPG